MRTCSPDVEFLLGQPNLSRKFSATRLDRMLRANKMCMRTWVNKRMLRQQHMRTSMNEQFQCQTAGANQ